MICLRFFWATFGEFQLWTKDPLADTILRLTKPTVMWDHFGTTCLQPMKLLKVGKVLKTIEDVLVCHET